MAIVEQAAVTLAALAVFALAIRGVFLMQRVGRVWERVDRTIESELSPAIRACREAAQGIQQTAGKLEEGLTLLASSLERVERLTAYLEPESVARTVVQPLVARILSWLTGARRSARPASAKRGESKAGAGEAGDIEAG